MLCDKRFEVCGVIEMLPLAIQSRTVRLTNAAGELADTVTALEDGTFCVYCMPGVYHFSVGDTGCVYGIYTFNHVNNESLSELI